MNSWRDDVINEINSESASIVLVHDQDLILNDEDILHELRTDGFDIIRYEDNVSFRYIFETQYRQLDPSFRILVYTDEAITYPYEYVKNAAQINLSIKKIFPKLSAKILRELEIAELDLLYKIYPDYKGSDSDEETIEFLVKHLYKIPYEIITDEAELYSLLLSFHYERRTLPPSLQTFLINKWKSNHALSKLPLRELLQSQTFFYHYLEKMWESLMTKINKVNVEQVNDIQEQYSTHPLADSNVRRLMNDLFIEGAIKRVEIKKNNGLPDWVEPGIESEGNHLDLYDSKKLSILREKVETTLKNSKQYKDWITVVQLLSEYSVTALSRRNSTDEYKDLLSGVNNQFTDWIKSEFHTLVSLPPLPNPKLVHHIPQFIEKQRKYNEKIALIVLDGMSFMQWRKISNYLHAKDFNFEENAVFAWIPTLTSVSRQSIFSGLMPLQFANTIQTTSAEERLWKSFWEKHGVLRQYVTYQKGLGSESYNKDNISGIYKKLSKVYGAVIDVIDQFSHHAVLGTESVESELNIWLKSDYLTNYLNDLIDARYTVYITSDHGNTVAKGIGRYHEGVLVEQRGERVRIYNDELIYEQAKKSIPGIAWKNIGLPENYYGLFSNYGEAYTTKGKEVITHGGLSIEEVIVPFVKVNKV